jgi:hypothetical protein
MTRALLVALLASALLAPTAFGDDPVLHPPKMPNSTSGAKKCGLASRYGGSFRVFITKGKSRLSCAKARKIVAHKPPTGVKHYEFFDWTKGGNGPWSDVYYRHDHRVVIGAILRDV